MAITPGGLTGSEARTLNEKIRRLDQMVRLRASMPLWIHGANAQPVIGIDPCQLRAMLSHSDCSTGSGSGSGAGTAVVEIPAVTAVECASGSGIAYTTTTYRITIDFVAQTATVEVV